jgi:outer membrane protein OmpA-like peptidoglycan-associated protein
MSFRPTFQAPTGFEAEQQPQGPIGVPGKSTLTSRLAPRPVNLTIMRDASPDVAPQAGQAPQARDANGVATGADAAVERAATSSGQPLPGPIQRRFESSLGADLSEVRVHTGPESAEAAAAVGARAYATGQDIHFAAGAYQPDDPFGMHLLAHEVAHTVQQAGGPATRQHKLEVSAPSDSAEVEADRAADAMVAGAPASVGSAAGTQRNFDDAFESWAGGGGPVGQGGGGQTSAGGPGYQLASNANERGPIKATIYFPTDGDTLSPDDHAAIDQVVARYGAEIDGGNYRIEVIGYADQRAAHGYNLDLANRRGDGVCYELGIRLRNGLPTDTFCEAVGEVPSGNSAHALAENRRVEIRLFPSEAPPPYPMPPLDPPQPKAPGWQTPPDWGTEWELYVDIAANGGGTFVGLDVARLRIVNVKTREEGAFIYTGLALGYSKNPVGAGAAGGPYPFTTSSPVALKHFPSHDTSHAQAGVSAGQGIAAEVWILTGPRKAGADVVYVNCSGTGYATPNAGVGGSMGPLREEP